MSNLLNIINCSEASGSIRQLKAEIDGSIVKNPEPFKDYVDDPLKQQLQQIQKQIVTPAKRKADLIAGTDYNDEKKKLKTNPKYCQPCDLELTSIQHAAQHYAGRKHRNVVEKMAKPSGMGNFNQDTGMWMRNKQHVKKVENDGRFGIGDAFKLAAQVNFTPVTTANYYLDIAPISESLTAYGVQQNIPIIFPKTCNSDKNVLCEVCNIYVSSAAVMEAHEKGVKHLRKLKLLSTDPAACNLPVDKSIYGSLFIKQEDITAEDWSMYRTPSGAYYCKACDINLTHEATLKQHVSGKKHLKRELEFKQQAAVVNTEGQK